MVSGGVMFFAFGFLEKHGVHCCGGREQRVPLVGGVFNALFCFSMRVWGGMCVWGVFALVMMMLCVG